MRKPVTTFILNRETRIVTLFPTTWLFLYHHCITTTTTTTTSTPKQYLPSKSSNAMTSNSWSLSLIALLRKSLVNQIKPFSYDLGRRSLTVAEYPILIGKENILLSGGWWQWNGYRVWTLLTCTRMFLSSNGAMLYVGSHTRTTSVTLYASNACE